MFQFGTTSFSKWNATFQIGLDPDVTAKSLIDYDIFGSPAAALLLLVYGALAFFIERDTKGIGDKFGLWGIGGYTTESERFTRGGARVSLLGIYLSLMWHFVRQILAG